MYLKITPQAIVALDGTTMREREGVPGALILKSNVRRKLTH